MEINTTMRTLRQRSGLSQEKLARCIGKTVSAISKWDQGITFPQLLPSELKSLMDSLGCTLDELIEAEQNWRDSKNS